MLWAGDTRVKLIANITAYAGDVGMTTITAPGSGDLPWEDAQRLRVAPSARYRWNRSAPARRSAMHRKAAQRTRRKHGRFRVVATECEYQRRGVLHWHVVLGMATAQERNAAATYVRELVALSPEHGFGWVDRGKLQNGERRRSLERVPAGRAASYLAKYLAPVSGGKMSLSETVLQPDVPPHVTYVARELTMRTRVTMRTLRMRRLAFVLARERGAAYESVLEALVGDKPTLQLLVGTDDTRISALLAGIPPP